MQNNGQHPYHEENEELDIATFFAYLMIMVERLGGECFIPKYQIASELDAMDSKIRYLSWYDNQETDSVVFKVMSTKRPG